MNPLLILALIGAAPFIVAALLMTSSKARKVFVWLVLAIFLGVVVIWPLGLVLLLYH
jgi:hypothetical protein